MESNIKENTYKQVEKRIKKDPLKSVAITFGIGFLAAWLLKK